MDENLEYKSLTTELYSLLEEEVISILFLMLTKYDNKKSVLEYLDKLPLYTIFEYLIYEEYNYNSLCHFDLNDKNQNINSFIESLIDKTKANPKNKDILYDIYNIFYRRKEKYDSSTFYNEFDKSDDSEITKMREDFKLEMELKKDLLKLLEERKKEYQNKDSRTPYSINLSSNLSLRKKFLNFSQEKKDNIEQEKKVTKIQIKKNEEKEEIENELVTSIETLFDTMVSNKIEYIIVSFMHVMNFINSRIGKIEFLIRLLKLRKLIIDSDNEFTILKSLNSFSRYILNVEQNAMHNEIMRVLFIIVTIGGQNNIKNILEYLNKTIYLHFLSPSLWKRLFITYDAGKNIIKITRRTDIGTSDQLLIPSYTGYIFLESLVKNHENMDLISLNHEIFCQIPLCAALITENEMEESSKMDKSSEGDKQNPIVGNEQNKLLIVFLKNNLDHYVFPASYLHDRIRFNKEALEEKPMPSADIYSMSTKEIYKDIIKPYDSKLIQNSYQTNINSLLKEFCYNLYYQHHTDQNSTESFLTLDCVMPPTIDTRKILFVCKIENKNVKQWNEFKKNLYQLIHDSPADLRNPIYISEQDILANSIEPGMLGPVGDKTIIYTIYSLIVRRYNQIKDAKSLELEKDFEQDLEIFLNKCRDKKINIIPLLDTMILSYFFQVENIKNNKKLIGIVSKILTKVLAIGTMKNILIVDDDVNTSQKFKEWLEDKERFDVTLINELSEPVKIKPVDYDLVIIGFNTSIDDGFATYDKLREKLNSQKDLKICFMTSSIIDFELLADQQSKLGKEHSELSQGFILPKDVTRNEFINYIDSLGL